MVDKPIIIITLHSVELRVDQLDQKSECQISVFLYSLSIMRRTFFVRTQPYLEQKVYFGVNIKCDLCSITKLRHYKGDTSGFEKHMCI